ncbi:hypothetical protein [Roseofilum casamattae]|uniref:Uncharacterized protein n=1 Tax=Roseofilum casamattae BLCC-M143 TaxID=3022442 RepID=A0ABT7C3B9_9CYAN|nr:hypothetical protein [Roseofilum casamattae]MDJ1185557.1 hypothetical protein [Roseofilum casamattae BLCC-M143]
MASNCQKDIVIENIYELSPMAGLCPRKSVGLQYWHRYADGDDLWRWYIHKASSTMAEQQWLSSSLQDYS